MKKSLIKYFGVASTTLLAVAPVAAPVVQSALNATLTNKVFAADNTGTRVPMDLTGQNEYSQLLQKAINNADTPFVSVNGEARELTRAQLSDSTNTTNVGPDKAVAITKTDQSDYNNINANTVAGLILLAQYTNGTNGYDNIENDHVFITADGYDEFAKIHRTDVAKYLFTNTDGTTRTNVGNFYYYRQNLTRSNGVKVDPGSSTREASDKAKQVMSALKYLTSKLGGHNVADVLGSSVFGNRNDATLKISINGSNGQGLNVADVLKQGRIVVTLTAESGSADGSKKTAQAFLDLNNSTVLLNKSLGSGKVISNDWALWFDTSISTPVWKDTEPSSEHPGTYLTSGATQGLFNEYANTANFGQFGSFFEGLAGSLNVTDITTDDLSGAPYDANDTSAATILKKLTDKDAFGAYATDAIVVPEGTPVDNIINKLKNVRYNGTPSISNYGSLSFESNKFVAFDDVVAKSDIDWDNQIAQANGNSFSNVTAGSAAASLSSVMTSGTARNAVVARPGAYSVQVPVTGTVYTPTKANNSNKYQFTNAKPFMKNYSTTTKVNVVVYANPSYWNKQYTLGTLPSFALFAPTTSNAVVPTFYDNGQTVKEADLPHSLQSKNLNITVGDARFYDPSSKTTSQNKLNSYLRGAFGNAVYNKQILISDEDVKSSRQPIDTNNLKPDVDFPDGANYYTQRPDNNTNNAGDGSSFSVDSSAVDLSKAGTYDVKITYTNAKNGKFGLGKEQSTITIPLTVGESDSPAFYFVGGLDQTIKVGESFNRMNFKVAKSLDEINQMVANGTANDGKDYVNDPSKTGVDVSISGTVDTAVPGSYNLVYTATNVSNGKTTTLTRRINVVSGDSGTDSSKDNIIEFKATGYVDYVPGYGINVWDAPNGRATGQKLPDASAWKISHKATANGKVWYQVGKNQWIDSTYVSLNPISRMKPMSGVVQIEYIPGYSVRVYQSADTSKPTDKLLKHGTTWKVFGEMNGFYNVGKNQWIKVEYGKQI